MSVPLSGGYILPAIGLQLEELSSGSETASFAAGLLMRQLECPGAHVESGCAHETAIKVVAMISVEHRQARSQTAAISSSNPAEKVTDVTQTLIEIRDYPALILPESSRKGEESRAQRISKSAKSLLKCVFWPDPPDPRKATRETIPGLVAYFFTGGVPVAHGVRDASSSGIYVLTTERWYLGTLVRMTLTDCIDPSIERSITANAMVVRWGNDGVGLKFLVQLGKVQRTASADSPIGGLDQSQIDRFLQLLKSSRG